MKAYWHLFGALVILAFLVTQSTSFCDDIPIKTPYGCSMRGVNLPQYVSRRSAPCCSNYASTDFYCQSGKGWTFSQYAECLGYNNDDYWQWYGQNPCIACERTVSTWPGRPPVKEYWCTYDSAGDTRMRLLQGFYRCYDESTYFGWKQPEMLCWSGYEKYFHVAGCYDQSWGLKILDCYCLYHLFPQYNPNYYVGRDADQKPAELVVQPSAADQRQYGPEYNCLYSKRDEIPSTTEGLEGMEFASPLSELEESSSASGTLETRSSSEDEYGYYCGKEGINITFTVSNVELESLAQFVAMKLKLNLSQIQYDDSVGSTITEQALGRATENCLPGLLEGPHVFLPLTLYHPSGDIPLGNYNNDTGLYIGSLKEPVGDGTYKYKAFFWIEANVLASLFKKALYTIILDATMSENRTLPETSEPKTKRSTIALPPTTVSSTSFLNIM